MANFSLRMMRFVSSIKIDPRYSLCSQLGSGTSTFSLPDAGLALLDRLLVLERLNWIQPGCTIGREGSKEYADKN